MTAQEEIVCSATLIILGTDLDPDLVSRILGDIPDKAWKQGERKYYVTGDGSKHYFDSYYEEGGWKRFIGEERRDKSLEEQIDYWFGMLKCRKEAVDRLRALGYRLTVDCCILSETTESLKIGTKIGSIIGELGVELQITFYSHWESTQEEV